MYITDRNLTATAFVGTHWGCLGDLVSENSILGVAHAGGKRVTPVGIELIKLLAAPRLGDNARTSATRWRRPRPGSLSAYGSRVSFQFQIEDWVKVKCPAWREANRDRGRRLFGESPDRI